jgi:hypothetical protein
MYNIKEIRKLVRKIKIVLFIYALLFISGIIVGTHLLYNGSSLSIISYAGSGMALYNFIKDYKDYKEINNILKQIIRGNDEL